MRQSHHLDTTEDNDRTGETEMYPMHEDVARVQMSARLGEARRMRLGHQVSRAQRVSRKAEKAARQARMSLAHAL